MKFQTENYILFVREKPTSIELADLQKLSKHELEEYNSLKNEKRKIEFALSRLMFRELLQEEYSEIVYEQSGKPTIPNRNISISHSASQVAVIVSEKSAVAVDIEEYRKQIFRVVSKFVRKEEMHEFFSLEDLILLWCAKEAIFKLTNASYDFLDFEVHKHNDELQGKVNILDKTWNTINLSYFRNNQFCLVWTVNEKGKQ